MSSLTRIYIYMVSVRILTEIYFGIFRWTFIHRCVGQRAMFNLIGTLHTDKTYPAFQLASRLRKEGKTLDYTDIFTFLMRYTMFISV